MLPFINVKLISHDEWIFNLLNFFKVNVYNVHGMIIQHFLVLVTRIHAVHVIYMHTGISSIYFFMLFVFFMPYPCSCLVSIVMGDTPLLFPVTVPISPILFIPY